MPKKQNLLGQRFGRLTVIEETRKGKYVAWRCKCDCGNTTIVISHYLLSGKIVSCGCYRKDKAAAQFTKDLTGQVFSELTVVGPTNKRQNGAIVWECKCSCGNLTQVSTGNLQSGHTRSCGHLHENLASSRTDITGHRYGRLVAKKFLYSNENKQCVWECECDCGNTTTATVNQLNSNKKMSCGCLKSKGEQKIIELLQQYNIPFEYQKTFPNCISPDSGYHLIFDFYIDNKYLVEFDGEQHFFYTENGWSNLKNFTKTKMRDMYKNEWCQNNNIPLIRIPYTQLQSLNISDILLEETPWLVEMKQKMK